MRGSNPLRQKLINLLYLVLIGMVVLNLPVEYIEAFTDLNRTLERANYRLDQKNASAMKQVAEFNNVDTVRFQRIYNSIRHIKAISDSTIYFLDSIKTDLITRGGGYGKYHHLDQALDASLPTRKLINDGVATDIKKRLVFTKQELMEYLSADEQTLLDTVLVTTETIPKATGYYLEWEKYYFDNVPLGAVVALITKFQNDVRLAESIVINKYYEQAENGVSYVLAQNYTTVQTT